MLSTLFVYAKKKMGWRQVNKLITAMEYIARSITAKNKKCIARFIERATKVLLIEMQSKIPLRLDSSSMKEYPTLLGTTHDIIHQLSRYTSLLSNVAKESAQFI